MGAIAEVGIERGFEVGAEHVPVRRREDGRGPQSAGGHAVGVGSYYRFLELFE